MIGGATPSEVSAVPITAIIIDYWDEYNQIIPGFKSHILHNFGKWNREFAQYNLLMTYESVKSRDTIVVIIINTLFQNNNYVANTYWLHVL